MDAALKTAKEKMKAAVKYRAGVLRDDLDAKAKMTGTQADGAVPRNVFGLLGREDAGKADLKTAKGSLMSVHTFRTSWPMGPQSP